MTAVRETGAKLRGLSGAADSVLSSLSNGLILYSIAVVSTAQYFGRISLLLTLLAAVVGCLRGALGTSLLLMAAKGTDEIRREGSYAITAALALSPILVAFMWLLGGQAVGTAPMILVAVATPIVLVQDVLRYVVIAEGRPQVAAIWDGTWFLGSLGLLVSTWLGSQLVTVNILIGGWGALALIALVGLAVSMRMRPRVGGFVSWLTANWQDRLRYAVDAGLEQGGYFILLAVVTALVSPVTTAALRGATALMAPIGMLTAAIPLVMIPESTRRGESQAAVWRRLAKIAAITTVGCLIAGVILRVLPASIGTLLLGNSFGVAQHIIVISAIEYAITAWAIGLLVWLKTFNRSAALLTMKILYVVSMLGLALAGAAVFRSATGVAVGMVIGSVLAATLSFAYFTPWRKSTVAEPVAPEAQPTTLLATLPARPPVWHHKVISRSRVKARQITDYVRLRERNRTSVSSIVVAMWTFAIMGIIGPGIIVMITGPVETLSWLGPLAIAVIAAARFSWIIGLGERRLFEIMFWTFTYAFMGLAPLTEIREQTWPQIVPRSDFDLVWPGVAIVLVGIGAFLLGVILNRALDVRFKSTATEVAASEPGKFSVRHNRIVLLAAIAFACNMYYSSKVGWIQFTQSRLGLNDRAALVWPSIAQMVGVRATVYVSCLGSWVGAIRWRREAKVAERAGFPQPAGRMRLNLLILWVIGILLANSMNPISNPRYLSGTAILAMLAGLGTFATVRRFRIASIGFAGALLVIFPIMDAFRYGLPKDWSKANPINALTSADFDSFANITNGYMIVGREGIRIMGQFLGVIFFWVPRGYWDSKPVDTGIYIANNRGYFVTNLSAPFWIEMYMNGGWILLILAMLAAGYFLHSWDTRIDKQLKQFGVPSYLGTILPFYMFILLRGSLLQAMPFLALATLTWFFLKTPSRPPRRKGVNVRGPTTASQIESRERDLANA
jgi:hypothetical protein